jgi:hypothetical protein
MSKKNSDKGRTEEWRMNCACCGQRAFLPLAVTVNEMPVCEDCRPKWVDGFVKAYEQDMRDKRAFLSFTLYAKPDDCVENPFGEDYPFLHAHLNAPFAEVAEEVAQLYEINFYELHLHMNTSSRMHNAYCSLTEDWLLVHRFFKSGNLVYLWLEPENAPFLGLLQRTGLVPQKDGYVSMGTSLFNPGGVVFKKEETGLYTPCKFETIPAEQFAKFVHESDDIHFVEPDGDDFYYELRECSRDGESYQDALRRQTVELLTYLKTGESAPGSARR